MNETQYNAAVGKRISKAQRNAKIDDYVLAGAAKCKPEEIAAYKKGRSPKQFRLALIARALNVSLDQLDPLATTRGGDTRTT